MVKFKFKTRTQQNKQINNSNLIKKYIKMEQCHYKQKKRIKIKIYLRTKGIIIMVKQMDQTK